MLYGHHTLDECEKEKARQRKSRCKKAGLALVSFSILALVLAFVILHSQGNVMNPLHSGSVHCYRKGRFTYSLFKIKKLHIL